MLKRGQGLPLETIIIVAVAVLVLVIVLLFATGAWSRLIGGEQIIAQTVTPEQISGFRLGCENYCFQAKQLANNPAEWAASDYCTKRLNNTRPCWGENITVICSKDIPNPTGEVWHCNATGTNCPCQ